MSLSPRAADEGLLLVGATVWVSLADGARPADVLIRDGHIMAVAPRGELVGSESAAGCRTVDCSGLTVIPGLIDGHSHLSWANAPRFGELPPEDHTLRTMHNARIVLEAGFTGVFSGAAAKPHIDVAVRDAIDSGLFPGPRMRAASQEITVTGGLGDARLSHLYRDGGAAIVDSPDEMRRAVRTFCRDGVDVIKLGISGSQTVPHAPAQATIMTRDEVRAAVGVAHGVGVKVAAHARSDGSVRLALEEGVDVIYHCEYAEPATIDLLEKHRDTVLVGPAIGWLYDNIYNSQAFGITVEHARETGLVEQYEQLCQVYMQLRERSVGVLVGGDYGFPWSPHGKNANDLVRFVADLGYSDAEALDAATRTGARALGLEHELGQVREGWLADLLVVDGEPHTDVRVLTDPGNIRMVIKDGAVYRDTLARGLRP